SLAGNVPEAYASVVLAERATGQERPSACLASVSTAQHRFLNKTPSPGRLDADADVCGGQQAQQEQPMACVVLVLHPKTGTKTRFLTFVESPPVLNQKFTNSGDGPQHLDVDVHGVPPVVKEHPMRSQMPRQGVLWEKSHNPTEKCRMWSLPPTS